MSLTPDTAAAADSNPLSDTEAQMRRALGLFGHGMRSNSASDRGEQSNRGADRFGNGGHTMSHQGLHRRRFVQDGEVPVTIVRRDAGSDSVAGATPQSSRLQRTEAALAAETAARDRAERALADAQAQNHDLQTKIGHAELARAEAVEILRREREAAADNAGISSESAEEIQELRHQIDHADQARRAAQATLAEERSARKAAERALRDAAERAETAEAALFLIEQEGEAEPKKTAPAAPRAPDVTPITQIARQPEARIPARRGRPPGSKSAVKPLVQPADEAEPVKWWLIPSPKAKAKGR